MKKLVIAAAVEAAPNFRIVPIRDLMGDAISQTASEQSVSSLFD